MPGSVPEGGNIPIYSGGIVYFFFWGMALGLGMVAYGAFILINGLSLMKATQQ